MTGNKEKNVKYIDRLNEDDPIPGQLFVCISFLSPEGIRNCTTRGLKIRGVYPDEKSARERADELQKIDPDFHVFVGEVGKWLPWDPDPNSVKDQKYQEEELQKLMDGYKENLEKTKKMEGQRKQQMLENAANEDKSRKDKINDRLRRKLEEKKKQKRMQDIAARQLEQEYQQEQNEKEQEVKQSKSSKKRKNKKNKNKTETETKLEGKGKELEEKEKLMKLEKERLMENEKYINEEKSKLETIDQKLTRIQNLYAKLNKKTNDKKNQQTVESSDQL